MGYKDTIIRALKNNIAFDGVGFSAYLHHTSKEGFLVKTLDSKTVKARYRILSIKQIGVRRFLTDELEVFTVDVEIKVWGKVNIKIYGKSSRKTKAFYHFIDDLSNQLTQIVETELREYKASLNVKVECVQLVETSTKDVNSFYSQIVA